MASLSLKDIGQQIQNLESQLDGLRKDYRDRETEMDRLQARKKELQGQLKEVDTKIATLEKGNAAVTASTATPKAEPQKKPAAKKTNGVTPKADTNKTTKSTKSKRTGPTLREVVTDLFKQARKPLKTSELAERALETGYQTASKNFTAVVQDLLKKMENVERIPGQGYRLIRDKS